MICRGNTWLWISSEKYHKVLKYIFLLELCLFIVLLVQGKHLMWCTTLGKVRGEYPRFLCSLKAIPRFLICIFWLIGGQMKQIPSAHLNFNKSKQSEALCSMHPKTTHLKTCMPARMCWWKITDRNDLFWKHGNIHKSLAEFVSNDCITFLHR